jgi:hypothetical protein
MWFPHTFRDALTTYLGVFERWSKPYEIIHPRILDAIRASGASEIIDFCAGNGVSALALRRSALADGLHVKWLLADRFPSGNFQLQRESADATDVVYLIESVDACATKVDGCEHAFRTLFTSFHHFRPPEAAKILQNAVDARAGIAIAEFTHRSIVNCLKYILAPLLVCAVMVTIRPIRWNWLFFTFVVPILPFTVAWDGIVSNLRTYSPDDLAKLVRTIRGRDTFAWEVGEAQGSLMFPKITYLIAQPKVPRSGLSQN